MREELTVLRYPGKPKKIAQAVLPNSWWVSGKFVDDLTETFHSFARLCAGIATVLLLLCLTPAAQAEVLEETTVVTDTTAATTEAVEAVVPTEAASAPSPAPEAEAPVPATEPVEKTVGAVKSAVSTVELAATPVEETVSRVAKTGPVSSDAASSPVSQVVSAVSKTVESAPSGPASKTAQAVEGVGGQQKDPSAPKTAPRGQHASLGDVASSPSMSSARLIGGAAEPLRAAPSGAFAADPIRGAAGGVRRGAAPLRGPGPRPESPMVGSAPGGGTSFVPVVALLALLALVAPATFRRSLAVPSSRAPAELACALERPG